MTHALWLLGFVVFLLYLFIACSLLRIVTQADARAAKFCEPMAGAPEHYFPVLPQQKVACKNSHKAGGNAHERRRIRRALERVNMEAGQ